VITNGGYISKSLSRTRRVILGYEALLYLCPPSSFTRSCFSKINWLRDLTGDSLFVPDAALHPSSAEKSPTETRGRRADEKDASHGKIVTYRRNQVQLTTNINARVERFVQTIKYEALNHFIAFGKTHLDYLVSEFVDYYNKHRAHSSREYLPPCCAEPLTEYETINLDEIHSEEHLGGLIKSYERIAA